MIRARRLTLFASLMLSGIANAPAMAELPRLLPVPAQMREGQGSFQITSVTPVRVQAGDAAARNAAERFADLVARSRGFRPRIETGSDSGNAISFRRAKTGEAEAYTLDVTPKGVVIAAADDAGLLYGAVTLWQAMTQDQAAGPVSVAAMQIADAPRFPWRGLMLDSARHFQSPAYVRQLIDWMAVNKLNRLHWHLVDDQGWRVEIPKYPRLTEISAWRVPAGAPGAPPLPKVGGFYTQAEIREIVAYAAARGIMIVPEIEMPGHALAAIRAYPKLGMGVPIPPGTESDWGVFPWLYNADDATFGFLEDVLTDVMALFPSPYIHIGGDEAVKDQWKSSPAMQAKMKALGIGSEDAMQGWFMHRIDDFLTKHGRKPIGWDEILEGGASPHATITSWRGIEGAVTAAKSGHDAILSPAPILYFDNRQGFGPLEPPGRGHLSDLHSVYDFNPEPEGLSAAEQQHILGLQGNLFTEHVRTEERAQWQQFPRGSAVAEIGWSPVESHDFASFMDRLVPQMMRMGTLGLKPAISALTVTAKTDYAPGDKTARVTLESQSGFPIHYTLDGSVVTPRAPIYRDGLSLPVGTRLRAGTVWRGGMMPGAIDIGLDATFLRRRTDEQLASCANKVVLSLEDDAPARGERAHFLTDILQPCWLYADAPVGGASKIAIDVGQLPFNFQIGKDRDAIHFRAPANPSGEVEVRAGSCEGERIAVLPLAPAAGNPEVTRLVAPIAPRSGKENLCITYTAKDVEPLWAIKQVELIP